MVNKHNGGGEAAGASGEGSYAEEGSKAAVDEAGDASGDKRTVSSLGEGLLKDMLKAQSDLNGASLQKRLERILDLRIHNEVRILKLIDEGLLYEENGEEVVSDKAIALHKSHKDSICELVKIHRLLSGLSTENMHVSVEEQEELKRLRGGIALPEGVN